LARELRIGFWVAALFLVLTGFLGGFSLCLVWQHLAQATLVTDIASLAQDLDQCQRDSVLLARESISEHNAHLRSNGSERVSTATVCTQGTGDQRNLTLLYTTNLCPQGMQPSLGPWTVLYDESGSLALTKRGG
jgi:hypothetical protein